MKIINLNSRSVTIELESNTPYYNEEEYEIFLNDNLIRKEKRKRSTGIPVSCATEAWRPR